MYDVIIVGAGPAGMTSAIYTARAGKKTLLLEKGAPGGKVFTTHLVENYTGEEKISGRELSKKMYEHTQKFGVKHEYGNVVDVEKLEDNTFKVITDLTSFEGKSVILATGTENKKLGVPGEMEFSGKGVSYCAICDGNFFRNKDVTVIGGGNSAIEESLYLADLCNSVTILHRRDTFRAEQFIIDRLHEKNNISIKYSTVLNSIKGDDKVNEIEIENVKTHETETLKTDGVFIYIGLQPVTQNFKSLNILNENGNIETDSNMRTSINRLYGAGDVRPKNLRQIATAVSDGALAASSAIEDLNI